MQLRNINMFHPFMGWTQRHTKISVGIIVGSLILAIGCMVGAFLYPAQNSAAHKDEPPQKTVPPTPPKWYSPLTGVEVPDEAAQARQVTAIMMENSMFARPQSGIKAAGIVFEAIAEGGITRFVNLYQESRPQLIGPVRSLRPYYIDWLAPFDAAVAHAGGSLNALTTIRNGQFKDIDEFRNGSYYWRADDRAAPHDLYTSFDKLDALNQSKGYTKSSFTPWPRKLDSPAAAPTAKVIDITISSSNYNVHYDYDAASNTYIRSEGGKKHVDREAGQLQPKVVVAMKVPTHIGLEDGYREQMSTIGAGPATFFQDGIVVQGFWRKAAQKSQIEFYDAFGRAVAFNAGQTWISVTAPDKKVSWQ